MLKKTKKQLAESAINSVLFDFAESFSDKAYKTVIADISKTVAKRLNEHGVGTAAYSPVSVEDVVNYFADSGTENEAREVFKEAMVEAFTVLAASLRESAVTLVESQ